MQREFALAIERENATLAEQLHLLRKVRRIFKGAELIAKPEAAQRLDTFVDAHKQTPLAFCEKLECMTRRRRMIIAQFKLDRFQRHGRILLEYVGCYIIHAGSHVIAACILDHEFLRLLPHTEMLEQILRCDIALRVDEQKLLRLAILGL